jgi:hypothetical protein
VKRTVGCLVPLLLVSCLAAFSADKASIVYIEGDVSMNGAPAAVGDEVPPGAVLATAKDSLCQIVFNAKNIVHMAAGTTLRFDPKAVSHGATLQKGAVAMVRRNLNPFISANPADELRFTSERQQRWQESGARSSLLRLKTRTIPTSVPATG